MVYIIILLVIAFFVCRRLKKAFKEMAEDQAYLNSIDEPRGPQKEYSDKVFEGAAIGGFSSGSASVDFTNAAFMNKNSSSKQ